MCAVVFGFAVVRSRALLHIEVAAGAPAVPPPHFPVLTPFVGAGPKLPPRDGGRGPLICALQSFLNVSSRTGKFLCKKIRFFEEGVEWATHGGAAALLCAVAAVPEPLNFFLHDNLDGTTGPRGKRIKKQLSLHPLLSQTLSLPP